MPALGRRKSALPSTPTGPPTRRNGRPIDACGAANPDPRILHAELALFVRLRHLSVSPTGERVCNAQEKDDQTQTPGAHPRAADFEGHAAKSAGREEVGGAQEEDRDEGRE